ncbi:chemotactic signal-response protein CheL [bacterium BMS3Bbin10]|nr:chemotactic signal-response protein CheL [bacterium BMS3Bbin10]
MDPTLANVLNQMARPASPQSIKGAAAGGGEAAARQAATEFEAVFLNTMLEGMFEGLNTDAPFGGGSAEKTYRSLLVTEYAKQISQNGGLGITDQITRDLIALQEGAQQ